MHLQALYFSLQDRLKKVEMARDTTNNNTKQVEQQHYEKIIKYKASIYSKQRRFFIHPASPIPSGGEGLVHSLKLGLEQRGRWVKDRKANSGPRQRAPSTGRQGLKSAAQTANSPSSCEPLRRPLQARPKVGGVQRNISTQLRAPPSPPPSHASPSCPGQ